MSVLIDEKGRAWPANSPRLAARIYRLTDRSDVVVAAVRWLGCILVKPVGRSALVFFRPELVTTATLAGTFGTLLRIQPDRVILSYGDIRRQPPEIFSDIDSALQRIEALADADRLPSRRPGIVAERLPLGRVETLSDSRATELLRAWSAGPQSGSQELRGWLRSAGLLSQTLLVRTPRNADRFLIEHWGSKRSLLGRSWARSARGREIREQPYPQLTEWVVATFRETTAEQQPRFDNVHATVITRQGTIHQRRYHRLLVPFRSSDGDTVSAVINIFQTEQERGTGREMTAAPIKLS